MSLWRSLSSLSSLVGLIGLCFGAGHLAGILTRPPHRQKSDKWYENLRKPPVMPPRSLFHPLWSVLYALMSVSAWLVWPARGRLGNTSKTCFLTQLGLNVAWSVVFFRMEKPRLAFYEQLAFWSAIAATITTFHRINALAARLLYPYLVWATFAVYMNFEFAQLNPDKQSVPRGDG